jgi:MurNAc alpha-1-phosphate uridylyltransferase
MTPKTGPKTAMVLAAGMGTRMRPLSLDRPKALVEVQGRALIDHTLDRLLEAGVERAVVNVHAFADQLRDHLAKRTAPEIIISDESGALLETGGGVKQARALLGEDPIWVAASDYVWNEEGGSALARLAQAWDLGLMDACVTVVPKDRTLGFDTPGDFFRDGAGWLTRRGDAAEAPYHCFNVQILDPTLVYGVVEDVFSLRDVWFAAAARGRLFGYAPDGLWMQVGDPQAVEVANQRLRRGG